MLKQFPSGKINSTKIVLFFPFANSNYHSFTFNLQFFYELNQKIYLSETVCGIFHFRFRFVFIKVYILVQ